MKIVILTYFFEPRLGYQEPYLAKELATLGHDVWVVTSNRRYPSGRIYQPLSHSFERLTKDGFFIEDGIKVIRLKSRFEIFARTWLTSLEKTIAELRPDIVQVNGITRFSSFRIPVLRWRKGQRFKIIYDEHMVYSVVRKGFLGKSFYALFRLIIRPLILSHGDAFAAITEETKVFMNKECGIPLSKIEVIPLGAKHDLFKFDEQSRKEIRKQYSISADETVFLYSGKVIPRKGPHLLLDSGLKLFRRNKNFTVFLLGNGEEEYKNQMKNKIKRNGFDQKVIWHGAVDNRDLYKFYSAADVGVWPLEESITILEAISCNLPIIVTDSLSLRDKVSYANGFAYRRGDTDDLARRMEQLLIDRGLRERMGKNGRELIEKRMNWNTIAKLYVELYSGVPLRS